MDQIEYIDGRGHEFVISYSQATMDEKDTVFSWRFSVSLPGSSSTFSIIKQSINIQ